MSKIYRISEFAERVGCGASSLRLWDSNGKFPAKKTATGQRYYTEEDVRKYLNLPVSGAKKKVVYCRVSSKGQSKDLESQVLAVEQFCISRGLAVDEWVKEIGGGLNFKRKKFLAVIDDLSLGKISILIVAHRDRLTRFGFDYFAHLAEVNGGEILVMNQESLSPQQEMVEDLMAIIHTFSCRLYGLRKYKKKLQEDLQ
jgi:predicted site-specific integrase-resolvase